MTADSPSSPGPAPEQPSSWILQVRQLLSEPPAKPPESTNGHSTAPRLVSVVCLYVESGELWTLLLENSELEEAGLCTVNFPNGISAADEDPWAAVARCTDQDLGLASDRVLSLGMLDTLQLGPIDQMIPCVVAVPSPGKEGAVAVRDGLVALPLSAFANPKLVEERTIDFDGSQQRLPVYYVGRHRLWGPVAFVLENLLQRLGT